MFEWLKGILPENITISPRLNINIKINSDNTSTKPVILRGRDLIINDEVPEGKIIANKIIKGLPAKMRHNDLMLEDQNLTSYQEVDQILSTTSYDQELEEFKTIVPRKDLPIIEVAILVKVKHEAGESVSQIKGQAVQRYGQRAGMICNLYSAGYFHSLIKPMYAAIDSGEIALDEYLEVYEMIVSESPLAMFIGINVTLQKAKSQLIEKVEFNKQVEVGYLNIHGIGEANIQLINTLLEDAEISAIFVEEPSIEKIGNSIKATIYF